MRHANKKQIFLNTDYTNHTDKACALDLFCLRTYSIVSPSVVHRWSIYLVFASKHTIFHGGTRKLVQEHNNHTTADFRNI